MTSRSKIEPQQVPPFVLHDAFAMVVSLEVAVRLVSVMGAVTPVRLLDGWRTEQVLPYYNCSSQKITTCPQGGKERCVSYVPQVV